MTLESAGQAAAEEIGIEWRYVPQDGKWYEVPADGKGPRNGAGRIKIFPDGEGGHCWNHITGEDQIFWARHENELNEISREQRRKKIEEQRAKTEAERKKMAQVAGEKAGKIWQNGRPAKDNPYLKRKGVMGGSTLREIEASEAAEIIGYPPKVKGEYMVGPILIVPIKAENRLSSCQLIDPQGGKHFLAGGQLRGGYWSAGKLPECSGNEHTILIAEGVATALSLAEASGLLAVAAMSCGNLPSVAAEMRRQYPEARLIVCSDKGNGESDARRAALESGGLVAIPGMEGDGTDFNDLHGKEGLEAVKQQILAAVEPLPFPSLEENRPSEIKFEAQNEKPLLFDEIQTPDIPSDLLPGWLGIYAKAVARHTQTPEAMAVMLALPTLATCTAKRFEVGPHKEGYSEPLNLWTVTVLPPANRKTAVISAMTAPLVEWERERAENLAPEIKRVKIERRTLEKRRDKLEKDAANTGDPTERQALLREIEQLEAEIPEELQLPRLWTGDTTPERLQMLLAEHGERMALLTDEGGIFEVMAGLYSDGRANLDIFLQGHAGHAVRVDRQARAAHLDAPALTFGLALQPAIIGDMGKGGKGRFRGNGTLARFLFAIPRSNIGKRDVRANNPIPLSVTAQYRERIFSLLEVPPQDVDGREVPRKLTLTPEALDSWHAFSEMVEERQGEGGDLEAIQDWSGKLPGAALRIAGNFHLVEHGPTPPPQIEAATIERALDLCERLIDHAKAAFDMMEADPITADAKAIFKWITNRRLQRFKRGEIWESYKGRFTGKTERLDKALKDLEARHIVTVEKEATLGRPAVVYIVNPAIWEKV